MSSAAPAIGSFPSDLRTLTVTNPSKDVQVKTGTLDTAAKVNTVQSRKPSAPGVGVHSYGAKIYTGKSDEFIIDISGLVSGTTTTIAFTDVNSANVPYSAKNKIDTIVFTPAFETYSDVASTGEDGSIKRRDGTFATRSGPFLSASNHPDVSMLVHSLTPDTARITVGNRINVYDGATMQCVISDATNTGSKLEFTAADSTQPPFLINGGPGDAPEFSVRVDASSGTTTTGVVSLDFGAKLTGKGIDISAINVNYTDSTSLSFTTVTLDSQQDNDLYRNRGTDAAGARRATVNQKKLTDAMIASGVLPGVFEISSANDKTYEFSAQLIDKAGAVGAIAGANSLGLMSNNAGPISGLTMNGIDRTSFATPYTTVFPLNSGLGGVFDVSWTAPSYVPSAIVGYKVYWLSGATDLSNTLNFPSVSPTQADKGKWRWLFATAKAKGQFVETTGTTTNAKISLPNSKVADSNPAWPYTDVSRQYYAWPVALTLDSAGNKVEGDPANSGIVDATTATGAATNPASGKAIEGCPSAPSAYKLLVGKDLVTAANVNNANLTNRAKLMYYDDKVENRGSVVTQLKAAIFRTKDIPYLPTVIADASFGIDISFSNPNRLPDDGIDILDLSANATGAPAGSGADEFLLDFYDDVSKVWRKSLTQGADKGRLLGYVNNQSVWGQSLINGESYTAFLKLGNANGFTDERSAAKSGTVSTIPNIRNWMMPAQQKLTTTKFDVKLLGDPTIAIDLNSSSAGADHLPAADASNSIIGTDTANLAGQTANEAIISLPDFPATKAADGAAGTAGQLDNSFALIASDSITLKWKETLDVSAGYFDTTVANNGIAGSNFTRKNGGIPVTILDTATKGKLPGSSLNAATGGSEITYLKYQVHTTYVNGAQAGALTAAQRFAAADPNYVKRLGAANTAAADAEFEYMTNFTNSVHFSTDICGGHYKAINETTGNVTDEHDQKTITVPYKSGDGKLKISHYYDASGNAQKLKNGLRYRVKLWGGNANGDIPTSDVSFTNLVTRGVPDAPTKLVTSGAAQIIVDSDGASNVEVKARRYKQTFNLTDIKGLAAGKGQFYQQYYVRAEQTVGGVKRMIGQATVANTTPNQGSVIQVDISSARNVTTAADAAAAEQDAFYGYPVTISVTGRKSSAIDGTDTAAVTSVADKSGNAGGAATNIDGMFGEDDADISGATLVKVFSLPMATDAGENEVPYIASTSGDKKATITWSTPAASALYVPDTTSGEAATSILGYTVTLYDASMGGTTLGFDTNNRKATVAAVKTQGHVGGDQSVQFDGLINGKVYIPRITTTYAYGAIGNRYTATTEGAYLGRTGETTSAAPANDSSYPGFVNLPDLNFGDTMLVDGTTAVIPRGLPIVSATAATGGNKLVIDDNGSNLTNALMLQISPKPTGTAPSVFSYNIATAAGAGVTTVNFHTNQTARIVKTFANSVLGNSWNSEINYLFVANAAGTTVGVTNLDTSTLGDNVVKIA